MPKVQKCLKQCRFPGCNYTNKYPYGIKNHERVHYPELERPYGCNLCKFRARSQAGLKRHLIVHSQETPYMCSFVGCEYKTKHRRWMKKVHRMKDVICDEPGCSFRSCSAEDLSHHRMTRHNVSRAFKCEHCSNRFGCSSNLTAHLRQKHGDLLELHFSKGKGSKGYCCQNSDHAFDSQVSILKHYATQKVVIVMLSRTEVHFL